MRQHDCSLNMAARGSCGAMGMGMAASAWIRCSPPALPGGRGGGGRGGRGGGRGGAGGCRGGEGGGQGGACGGQGGAWRGRGRPSSYDGVLEVLRVLIGRRAVVPVPVSVSVVEGRRFVAVEARRRRLPQKRPRRLVSVGWRRPITHALLLKVVQPLGERLLLAQDTFFLAPEPLLKVGGQAQPGQPPPVPFVPRKLESGGGNAECERRFAKRES
mmetsp:Transcript_38656/g.127974  ORF Transcript_38656/g.127974 Transcript_38656/m.127974 type:complete len:215 (+) Transcript_38656:132-776(+)